MTAAAGGGLEQALADLLGELCVEWGFCLPPASHDRIVASRAITADEFAVAVLAWEGLDPEHEVAWRRKLRRRFIDRFGGSSVGATGR